MSLIYSRLIRMRNTNNIINLEYIISISHNILTNMIYYNIYFTINERMLSYKKVAYSSKQYICSNVNFSELTRDNTITIVDNDDTYNYNIINVIQDIPTRLEIQCKGYNIILELDLTSTQFGIYVTVMDGNSCCILRFYCNRIIE